MKLATNKGIQQAQIAIAWLLKKGVTVPIVGISKISHLEEFIESLVRRFPTKRQNAFRNRTCHKESLGACYSDTPEK